ncbi:MAG: hypothetical protein ACYC6F_16390 [Longimicrobiales bacterium]
MTNTEPDTPVHRISRVEDRERLLAETLAHAEAQEAQYKVLPAGEPEHGRWKASLAAVLLVLAAWIALTPPRWIAGAEAPFPTAGERDRGLRAAIWMQARQVEVFRLREGRLPEHLSELPVQMPGLTLVRSNNRVFQIQGRLADGELLVFDSAQPSPAFEAAAPLPRAQGTP